MPPLIKAMNSSLASVQVYLQEFAWTEEHKPDAIAQRADHAQHAEERALLTTEPMFCFQTAVALHRWSCLTYMSEPRSLKVGHTCGLLMHAHAAVRAEGLQK